MINKNKSGLQIAREKKQMEPLELAALLLELAALLKVNESVLKGWEAGGGIIHLDTVIELMNILDTSSEMILFNECRRGLNIETLTDEQRDVIFDLYKLMKDNK